MEILIVALILAIIAIVWLGIVNSKLSNKIKDKQDDVSYYSTLIDNRNSTISELRNELIKWKNSIPDNIEATLDGEPITWFIIDKNEKTGKMEAYVKRTVNKKRVNVPVKLSIKK